MSKLAKETWQEHEQLLRDKDAEISCDNPFNEPKLFIALHSALVTLKAMKGIDVGREFYWDIKEAIDYLKGSKFYSEENKDADY